MDTPTVTNTTFLFHDLIPSPLTQITITVSNTDGSKSAWDIYILKILADQARSQTKAQLVALLNRQNADTTI
jgi:hypothetical protein